MTELSEKIFKSGSFDSVLHDYFVETFNDLIDLKFKDFERDVKLNENGMDFFYSIALALETSSIQILNESFNNETEFDMVDHINAIKKILSGRNKLELN